MRPARHGIRRAYQEPVGNDGIEFLCIFDSIIKDLDCLSGLQTQLAGC